MNEIDLDEKMKCVVIFNRKFVLETLNNALEKSFINDDFTDINYYLTDNGRKIVDNYISSARRVRPKEVDIRHFFNACLFYPYNETLKGKFDEVLHDAEKRFKGRGWSQEQIIKVYEIFNMCTAPILLDVERFHDNLNADGQLLYNGNLKICLSVMVSKKARYCDTYQKLDEMVFRSWTPKEIIDATKKHKQIKLSEYKIGACLENHVIKDPVLFEKDELRPSAYRVNWDNLILYDNRHN